MLARDPTAADHRDLVPAVWLPDPRVRAEREQARFRLHLVKHRSMLKHRIHSTCVVTGREDDRLRISARCRARLLSRVNHRRRRFASRDA
jgi:hypothetical protein